MVGDPVNSAARIEGLTVGGQVLVAESTVQAVGPGLEALGPHEIAVKGKAAPLAVYDVRSLDGVQAPDVAGGPGWPLDRSAALERLLGKRLGTSIETARIRRASPRRLTLDTAAELAVFDDVRVEVGGAHVYGKVVSTSDGVVVHVTGGDERLRAELATPPAA